MVAPDDNGRRVHAVETACRILEALHERDSDGGGVSELAADLGVSKATVHSHLATLQDNEFVVKRGDRYHIGLKFVDFGEHAKGTVDIYDIATSEVDQIAEETGEVAQFMIEEHGRGVYLHKARGDKAIQTASYTGNRKALHCTALGKAILSELPRERVEEIIERYGLPAVTERTITDRDELFEELKRIRKENVAFDNEEVLQGLRCVATPIRHPKGHFQAAISISGPTSRLKGERFREEIPEIVQGAANVIEVNATQV